LFTILYFKFKQHMNMFKKSRKEEQNLEDFFEYKEDRDGNVDVTDCFAIKYIAAMGPQGYKHRDELVAYSTMSKNDPERKQIDIILKNGAPNKEEDRAYGSMLGMVVGDALGAPMEFKPVQYGVKTITGMVEASSFSLQPGQWTDDASMGLCT
jgi:hypothetical protein